TAIELKSLLEKRVKRGLHCSILGRFSDEKGRAALTELSKIGKPENCTVLSWYEEANSKVQTFHFKAASADSGKMAYLGSANMTFSSLRSTMELGVLLKGQPAAELDAILKVVLSIATRIVAR